MYVTRYFSLADIKYIVVGMCVNYMIYSEYTLCIALLRSKCRFDWRVIFCTLTYKHTGSGAHPASYPVGTRGPFPGVRRPGREADRSPPCSAEVKEYVEQYLYSPNTHSWHGA
jgi:hypothetical protein